MYQQPMWPKARSTAPQVVAIMTMEMAATDIRRTRLDPQVAVGLVKAVMLMTVATNHRMMKETHPSWRMIPTPPIPPKKNRKRTMPPKGERDTAGSRRQIR